MNFLQYLINGISLGSVYAIIALGYTMVYGIAKMLNFAHGDVIMVGAYIIFTIISTMGYPPLVGVIVAVALCTVFGITIERIAYKPLRNATSSLAVLITAIGVSYFLQNMALIVFGANTKSFNSIVKFGPFHIGGLTISGETVATVMSCIAIM
ncbi:MAG: branched-chain amino acid ABC transporter permease, partial [Lachnospiraceae bacterium]|nr:branched-chain amino acid ABC transporter permease [Lachnospiraceae bacterium]